METIHVHIIQVCLTRKILKDDYLCVTKAYIIEIILTKMDNLVRVTKVY